MKFLSLILIAYCAALPGFIQADLVLIDKIECVVCGPEKNTPFTNTGITWKRGLDNKFVPLEQQIQREIVSQQLVAEKIPVDPTAVEKYIEGIKKQNNFSETDLDAWFGDVGRTLQEGLDVLAEQYNNEYFLHYKFKSQLVPTDDEVKEYFEENPDFVEGSYDVRAARVDFDQKDHDQVKKEVEKIIENPAEESADVAWSDPVRWMDEDVTEDKAFVKEMKVGEIRVLEVGDVFELYQLVAHEPTKLRSLEERRTSIVEALNRKKLEKMLADYNKSVREYIDVIKFGAADDAAEDVKN